MKAGFVLFPGGGDKFGALIRLVVALCMALKVSPRELVKNMQNSKKYAQELHDELEKSVSEKFTKAVKALSKED